MPPMRPVGIRPWAMTACRRTIGIRLGYKARQFKGAKLHDGTRFLDDWRSWERIDVYVPEGGAAKKPCIILFYIVLVTAAITTTEKRVVLDARRTGIAVRQDPAK
jgi:hypothetical protein